MLFECHLSRILSSSHFSSLLSSLVTSQDLFNSSSLSQIQSNVFSKLSLNLFFFPNLKNAKCSAHTHRQRSQIDSFSLGSCQSQKFTKEFLLLSGAYCNRGIKVSLWFNNFYHGGRFIFCVLIKWLKVRNTYIDRVYSLKAKIFHTVLNWIMVIVRAKRL